MKHRFSVTADPRGATARGLFGVTARIFTRFCLLSYDFERRRFSSKNMMEVPVA